MGFDPELKDMEDKHFLNLDKHEIKGASKNRNLLFLIIGDKYNASYLIYKQALEKLADKRYIKNSFLYGACFSPLDMKAYQKEFKIHRYPMLAVYYKGEIVAEITDLPGKFQAEQFILQIAMQAMLINLEGKLGAQMYRILKLKNYKQGIFFFF